MSFYRVLALLTVLGGFGSSLAAQECVISQGKLLPPQANPQQYFGRTCALSGDTCAVVTYDGNVSIFTRTAGSWSLQQSFAANWHSGAHQSGPFLSLDGDTLAVGDPSRFMPPSGSEAGAVDVYVRNGGTWTLDATLTAPPGDADAYDQLGGSVILRGVRLITGAQYDDEAGADAGAVYSFLRVGSTWILEAKLMNLGAADYQYLGSAVDFDGERCIATGLGYRTCIWSHEASGWNQEAEFSFAGTSIAIEGSLAALRNGYGCGEGPVWIFERVGSTWTYGSGITSRQGGGLAVRQQRIAVGRPGNDLPGCNPNGESTRIYSKLGGTWQVDGAAGPESFNNAAYGATIAFDGSTLLVSDSLDDQVAVDAGALWVFVVGASNACPDNYCRSKVNSLGCTPSMYSSGQSSAAASSGFVVGLGHVLNDVSGVAFYGLGGRASVPFLGGTLCLAHPIHRGPVVSTHGFQPGPNCAGALTFDMNKYAAGLLGGNPSPALRVPGTVVDLQWWARDPGFAPPLNVQLSAAQEYTVLP